MRMKKEPLVSILVVTYNSSEYIIETLNSCYSQEYKNIELIISDDKSSDNTVEICEEWLTLNASRFYNTCLLVSPLLQMCTASIKPHHKTNTELYFCFSLL